MANFKLALWKVAEVSNQELEGKNQTLIPEEYALRKGEYLLQRASSFYRFKARVIPPISAAVRKIGYYSQFSQRQIEPSTLPCF